MTEEVNPHFFTFHYTYVGQKRLVASCLVWPGINWLMLDFAEISDMVAEVILFYIYLLTLVLAWETQSCLSQMAFISLLPKQLKAHWKIGIPNVTIHNYRPEAAKTVALTSKLIILRHFSFKNCMLRWELNNVNLTWLQRKSPSCQPGFQYNSIFFLVLPGLKCCQCSPHLHFTGGDKAALFPTTASLSLRLSLDLPTVKNWNAAQSIPSEPAGFRLLWTQT